MRYVQRSSGLRRDLAERLRLDPVHEEDPMRHGAELRFPIGRVRRRRQLRHVLDRTAVRYLRGEQVRQRLGSVHRDGLVDEVHGELAVLLRLLQRHGRV